MPLPPAAAGAQALETKVRPGECIRVWRRYPAVPTVHGEWAEVIRSRNAAGGEERLLCETLQFDVFSFSPGQVARCCDRGVEKYQVVSEEAEKRDLRRKEVDRLHRALDENGRLGPCIGDVPSYPGFSTAKSQLRVKATVLELVEESAGAAGQRQDLQEEIERIFELNVAQLTQQMQSQQAISEQAMQGDIGIPVDNGIQPITCKQLKSGSTPKKHYPELCADCIRSGTWCSSSLHLPCATICLDIVAQLMSPGLQWRCSEAGLEAEMSYGDAKAVLLQIRPWLFCIPDVDAALFGSQSDMLK